MLGLSGWSFTWNDENRLVAAETPTNVGGASARRLEYSYDYQGRRRTRKVHSWDTDHWSLITTHSFIWDGWLLLAERITQQATGETTTRTYTCGLDLSGQLGGEGTSPKSTAGGIGGMLAVTTTSPDPNVGGALRAATSLFVYDGNGNVVNLVDATTAEAVATYEYSPFGRTLVAHGPLADENPIRFSTKYAEDAQTAGEPAGPELCYYGYRYYSPELGRWASRDPIGEMAGENLYGFVGNSPVDDVDRLGLMTSSEIASLVAYWDGILSKKKCCCFPKLVSGVFLSLTTKIAGATITGSLGIRPHGCVEQILTIYWWDCVTAQYDAPLWTKLGKSDKWQDWGWYSGGTTKTMKHVGKPVKPLKLLDPSDAAHWAWSAGVVYTYCGALDGRLHAGWQESMYINHVWNDPTKSWTPPVELPIK